MSDNLKGAAWMTTSMFAFTANDAFMKRVAEDLPLFQAVFLRGFPLIALLAVIARMTGGLPKLSHMKIRPLQLRVVMEMMLVVTFLLTLVKVPLGALSAIIQLVPILVSFAAARMLHESVNLTRVIALVLGFVGVVLVVQPGSDDFNPWFILGFVTVAIIVVRELSTRQVTSSISAPAIALITAIAVSSVGGVLSLGEGWERPSGVSLLLILGAAAFIALAHIAAVTTIRMGDLSFSALFRPTALVFAMILQVAVFRDIPNALTLIGCGVIFAAALLGLSPAARRSATVA